MLFGSSDAANAITVDKTPASLWVMDISVRIFGLNPWSVLVPQALEGVAAVALLYAAVRRVSGPGAALLAGAVMALTPGRRVDVPVQQPRRAAGALLWSQAPIACSGRAKRTAAVGGWSRRAPRSASAFWPRCCRHSWCCRDSSRRTWWRAVARWVGGCSTWAVSSRRSIVSAGWYLLLVEVWPSNARPYIGGSQHDSIIELALGYNGFGRLTGDEPGGLGNLNFDVGWARLFGHGMGVDIAWLLPAAVICLGAIVVLTRRAPRTDPIRAAAFIWGGWLFVTAVVFSFMNGIVHPYYTVALAPAIAASGGHRRNAVVAEPFHGFPPQPRCRASFWSAAILACVLLARTDGWLPWLRAVVAVGGVGGGGAAAGGRPAEHGRPRARWRAWLWWRPWLRPPRIPLRRPRLRTHGAIPSVGPSGRGGFGAAGARRPVERPYPGSRPGRHAGRRRRTTTRGRGGDWLEQRGGLPIGQRRAGDGGRRLQRDRSISDAAGVPALRRRQADPLLHPRPVDDRAGGEPRPPAAAKRPTSRSGWRPTSRRRPSTAWSSTT